MLPQHSALADGVLSEQHAPCDADWAKMPEPAYISLNSEPPPSVSGCPESGSVWLLSTDAAGCRRVQDALDKAASLEARMALAHELHGHVVKAMRDPNANHVLQKCISTMPADSLQFMIDEIMSRDGLVTTAARHRYGCRIIQQLLKKCGASQINGLSEALLQDTMDLSLHTFGNFSIQHLMQFGTEDQRQRLVLTVVDNVGVLSRSVSGSGVVAAAMEHAASEDRVSIARAVLQEPEALPCLAQVRRGNTAVLQMLQVLDGREHLRACLSLAKDVAALRGSRYGRPVADYLVARAQEMAL